MAGSSSDAAARFQASAISAALAETLTLPTDVAKARLQVHVGGSPGMITVLRDIVEKEGVSACWKGLQPALIRQVCYTSLSLVLYEPVRDAVSQLIGGQGFGARLLAGGTAGGLAIMVFNPTEVLKTQMQTSREGVSMGAVLRGVYANGGVPAFWAGWQPNLARTFLVNAAEIGTYDQAKHMLVPIIGDNPVAHVGASGVAGVASACTSTPADVVKTRLMNQSGGVPKYSGVLDALASILREEGALALYKGFVPIVVRKVLWCSIFFVSYERVRSLKS